MEIKRQINQYLDNSDTYICRVPIGSIRFRGSYIYNRYVGAIKAPVIVNGWIYKDYTQTYEDTFIRDYVNSIIKVAEENAKSILFVKLLTLNSNPELPRDLYEDFVEIEDESIINSFGVTYKQITDRFNEQRTNPENHLDYTICFKFYKHITKNIFILLANHHDDAYFMDYYTMLGLLPDLVPDFKRELNEKEIEYFKQVFRRSQLKRITNKDVKTVYDDLESTRKYLDYMSVAKLDSTVRNYITRTIYNLETSISTYERDMELTLKSYTESSHMRARVVEQLHKYNTKADSIKQDFLDVLNDPAVIDYDLNTENVRVCVKMPLNNYNPDEAELALKSQNEPGRIILHEIFIEQKYTIYATSFFVMNLRNPQEFIRPRGVEYTRAKEYKAIPNPHYYFHGCTGSLQPELIKAQTEGDLRLFVNLAKLGVSNINFSDGATIRSWVDEINRHIDKDADNYNPVDVLCLEDKEGNPVCFRDVLYRYRNPEIIEEVEPGGENDGEETEETETNTETDFNW